MEEEKGKCAGGIKNDWDGRRKEGGETGHQRTDGKGKSPNIVFYGPTQRGKGREEKGSQRGKWIKICSWT
jgi:hypothetical protein